MKKLFKLLVACTMAFTLVACGPSGSDSLAGTYSMHVDGFDWGCGTTKAIITFDNVVDAITAEDFTVTETKAATDWTDPTFAVKEQTFNRTVTKAYLSDANGVETTEPSNYVTLELAVDPNTGSPFNYDIVSGLNSWCDPYYLTIGLSDSAQITSGGTQVTTFAVETTATSTTTAADMFTEHDFTAKDGTAYKYATYEVEGAKTLFVWLHGMGEGGTDTSITLLANKVTAFAGEDFQNTIGKASILVPQAKTFWMDEPGGMGATGDSIYTDSLIELIDTYKAEIGAEKVVISGCSNGGYMTMVLALEKGDQYDAYVPICEALIDTAIDNKEIALLASLPMYFIYSEDDTTVVPTDYEVPTINRMKSAGATNIHVSTTTNVVDMTGEFKNADGTPYAYNGHWSWIYFDNDDTACDDCEISAWDWIAQTLKAE